MASVPPLALPSAALSYSPAEHHPDSEEALQMERQRVAQELDVIHSHGLATTQDHQTPPTSSRRRPSQSPDNEAPTDDVRSPRSRQLSRKPHPRWHDPITTFWTTQISLSIAEGAHRDHLALERTFLAYVRTSLALAMTGVLTAQLFRLQHAPHPDPRLGFFVLGIPLAATFICTGMVVLVVGAARFWRQQRALVRGQVYAGGWDVVVTIGICAVVLAAAFGGCTAVDVRRTWFGGGGTGWGVFGTGSADV